MSTDFFNLIRKNKDKVTNEDLLAMMESMFELQLKVIEVMDENFINICSKIDNIQIPIQQINSEIPEVTYPLTNILNIPPPPPIKPIERKLPVPRQSPRGAILDELKILFNQRNDINV